MGDETNICERCGTVHPFEGSVYSEGCYFCPRCWAEWRQNFDACQHKWEPHHNEHGDPGKICRRCCGFVSDENFADALSSFDSSRGVNNG
jgi:hypothetical protein